MTPSDILTVVHAIAGFRERKELLPRLVAALRPILPADWYLVTIRRGRDAPLFDGYAEPAIAEVTGRPGDYYMTSTIQAIRFRDTDLDGVPAHQAVFRRLGVRAAVRTPLIVEGALVGSISTWSRDPDAFARLDLSVMTELGMAVGVILDSCLAYEHLAQLRDEAVDESSYLRDALATALQVSETMVGHGAAFSAVKRQIELVAPTEATVLLTGESGTGKDVAARAIHAASNRRDRPLVTVNCAAIPASLAESELFGHEEGAFTGASRSRPGRFEQAHGGTLFLDEIGELPLEVQAKLLRVLQERELERVGGGEPIKVDVRIIAATNRDLQELILADRFREDLFFRLAVFPIHLPPLRSRLEDLPALVDHLVKQAAERFRVPPRIVTPEAIRRLADHDWPGNVRELQHAIERAMIVSPGDALAVDAIVPRKIAPISTGAASDSLRAEYTKALETAEWVIEGPGGAAARLGVHPNTLRHRLKRMGIARPTRAEPRRAT